MTGQDRVFIEELIEELKADRGGNENQVKKYDFVIEQATNLLNGKEVDIDGMEDAQMINPHVVGHIAMTAMDYQS